MDRLSRLFQEKQQDILNIYFTAGYPNLQDTETIIHSLEKSGVDLIEIGMPYSDPMADGPTIQESGDAALLNGMTLEILFDQITAVRKKSDVPLIMMGYFNQMMQYGELRFLKKCKEVGVDGLILPDLPLEVYETEYKALFEEMGLHIIFLITPQTPDARIHKIDSFSSPFIYMVSNAAITGAKVGISDTQISYFERIQKMGLQNPRLIGFGISNYETYRTACDYSSGAIIGSAFIKALKDAENLEERIEDFVNSVKGTTLHATNTTD
ncbi:MAG: tryptophan synthase subunit alpha [Saprospiraceae bacterium]